MEILEHASHACLYQFGPAEPGEQGAWKRIGVEGPLYVVKRSQLPSLQIVIHNRKVMRMALMELSRPVLDLFPFD